VSQQDNTMIIVILKTGKPVEFPDADAATSKEKEYILDRDGEPIAMFPREDVERIAFHKTQPKPAR
jgi:hypothetical protein